MSRKHFSLYVMDQEAGYGKMDLIRADMPVGGVDADGTGDPVMAEVVKDTAHYFVAHDVRTGNMDVEYERRGGLCSIHARVYRRLPHRRWLCTIGLAPAKRA